MFNNLAYIPLFPLLGALLTYLLGTFVNRQLSGWVASIASTLSFIWVIGAVNSLPEGGHIQQVVFTWFSSVPLHVDFALKLDHLSAVMCLVVTGIGSLIHFYSIGYMLDEPAKARFFAYLNLFMFAMLLLVLGANLLVVFVGWEGVGLCSYLLIGFWFKNLSYSAAGRKAFVVNRIGDAGFLLAVFLLYQAFGTVDFSQLAAAFSSMAPDMGVPVTIITLCLFVGAVGKSAQIPLFVWLPDAMAGPTPVSALIHAATMVTAGVYLLARTHFMFAMSPTTQAVIMGIAALTAFVAATTALTQYDIKKVLAYSTVSQLGFMFLAAAAGAWWVAIFHVVTHAFFKACLFLGAGSVIHGCHHEQDMRKMGGLRTKMPITFITYLLSTLAIAGIFPLAGYYSKHAILLALGADNNPLLTAYATLLSILVSVTAFLTAFYMMRSVMMTFFGSYRGHAHPHESPLIMTVPLMVLAFLAVFGGLYLAGPLGSPDLLQKYLSSVIPYGHAHPPEGILAGLMHSWVGIAGVLLAVVLYSRFEAIPRTVLAKSGALGRLFQNKYYFDEIYNALIVAPLERTARMLWKGIDQAVVDGTVNGTAALIDLQAEVATHTQSGQIRQYALWMFLATLLLLIFCFWL